MFHSLLKRLTDPPSKAGLPQDDEQLALAALMMRVAMADNHLDLREIEVIDRVLMSRFDLDARDAATLREEALEVEAAATDTVPLTRLIKDTVPYEARIGVVEALWEVALADEERTAEENAMLRLVTNLIGVPDIESGMARQRVMDRLRSS